VAGFNLVLVSGYATRNAILRRRISGISKAEFTLEVDRPFERVSGAPVSDLFLVDVYGPLAERCADVVTAGTPLLVLGTLNKETYLSRLGDREHLTIIKCKYLKVVESGDADFGAVSRAELQQDEWGDKMIRNYLRALSRALTRVRYRR